MFSSNVASLTRWKAPHSSIRLLSSTRGPTNRLSFIAGTTKRRREVMVGGKGLRQKKFPKVQTIRSGSPSLHHELQQFMKSVKPADLKPPRNTEKLPRRQFKQQLTAFKKKDVFALLDKATSGRAKPKRFTYNMVMAHLVKGVAREMSKAPQVQEAPHA